MDRARSDALDTKPIVVVLRGLSPPHSVRVTCASAFPDAEHTRVTTEPRTDADPDDRWLDPAAID
jgi:hypothetical protein